MRTDVDDFDGHASPARLERTSHSSVRGTASAPANK